MSNKNLKAQEGLNIFCKRKSRGKINNDFWELQYILTLDLFSREILIKLKKSMCISLHWLQFRESYVYMAFLGMLGANVETVL